MSNDQHSLISHVGIAVKNLNAAMKQYATIAGHEANLIEEVAEQRVRVAMFAAGESSGHGEGGRVELLEGTSPDSPITKFIEKRGEGLHHICIYVDDIDAKLTELKTAGVRLIDEQPRIGAGGCRIAFVHPAGTSGVLIELEEKKR